MSFRGKYFDGLTPHTGSNARGSFNHRFAQPSRAVDASYFYPGDQFPFTDVMQPTAVGLNVSVPCPENSAVALPRRPVHATFPFT